MEESYSGSCAWAAVYPLSSSKSFRLMRDLFCGEEHGTSTPRRYEPSVGHWFEDIEPIALGAGCRYRPRCPLPGDSHYHLGQSLEFLDSAVVRCEN